MILSVYRYLTESFYIKIANSARDTSSSPHVFLAGIKISDNLNRTVCKMVIDSKNPIKLNPIDVLLCQTEIRQKIYLDLGVQESDLPYPIGHPEKSNYFRELCQTLYVPPTSAHCNSKTMKASK